MLIAAAPKLREQCMGCSTSSERDVAALEDFIADHKRNEKLVKDLKSTNAETRALNVEKTTRDLHPLFDKVEQHAKNKTLGEASAGVLLWGTVAKWGAAAAHCPPSCACGCVPVWWHRLRDALGHSPLPCLPAHCPNSLCV